jgi:4-amino-4-deoxy-L-arabinose transferase-like glycosyltransferase
LWGIVVVALAARIWTVLTLPQEEQAPTADALQYDMIAVNLSQGRGFSWPANQPDPTYASPARPTSMRAPLYPAFLAAIYRVFGHDYLIVRLIQCVLGALLCVVVYGIGALWGMPRVGLVAAAITAVYPPFATHFSYYGGPDRLTSEGLFMLLLAASAWGLLRLSRDVRHRPWAVTAGVVLGLATLTRPVALLVPAVLVVWAFVAPRRERGQWLRAMAIVCAAFVVTLLPWTLRNYRVQHRFVPVTTVSGKAFWVGNNPWARGGAVEGHQLFDRAAFNQGLVRSEVETFDAMKQEGLRFWREHPTQLPKLFFRKLLMMWNVYELRYNFAYGLLLPWALLGLVVTWRAPNPQANRLLVGLLAYLSLMAAIFFGSTRYRYPFEPYVILFAAAGLVWWFARPTPKWIPATALAGVVGLNLALFLCSDRVLQILRGSFQTLGLR